MMHHFDGRPATIICDSREKRWEHVKAFLERSDLMYIRSKLPVGDYALMTDLSTVVDRKAGLGEVESNLIHDHARFRRECELAKEHGVRLIILVESGKVRCLDDVPNWENPRRVKWEEINAAHAMGRRISEKIPSRPPADGATLHKIMKTMQEKYGIEWRFCLHQNAGEEICRIIGIDVTEPSRKEFVSV